MKSVKNYPPLPYWVKKDCPLSALDSGLHQLSRILIINRGKQAFLSIFCFRLTRSELRKITLENVTSLTPIYTGILSLL